MIAKLNTRLASREGFVMPAVILAMLIMSAVAAGALLTADDERRSSRAVREGGVAYYTAQAGLNKVWATWDDSLVATLAPGDSLDLGWRTLENAASYRAVVHRYDNGGQEVYALTVESRGAGALRGQRVINLDLSAPNAEICCTAAVRGGGSSEEAELDSLGLGGVTVSGRDTLPATWGATCDETTGDLPGIEWKDTTKVEIENSAVVEGNPPVVQDTAIDSQNLYQWGHLNYDSLVARANITIGGGPHSIGPVENPPGTCDTSVPTNWGAPDDPTHPCFDYFPIIHVANELELELQLLDGVPQSGQGILLVDGSLEIEKYFNFYGIIIVKDEFEMEDNVHVYGGVIVGGELEVEDGASIQYSQCAVNRSLANANLTVTKLVAGLSGVELLR